MNLVFYILLYIIMQRLIYGFLQVVDGINNVLHGRPLVIDSLLKSAVYLVERSNGRFKFCFNALAILYGGWKN